MDKRDFLHNWVAPLCAVCAGLVLTKFVVFDTIPWAKVSAYLAPLVAPLIGT